MEALFGRARPLHSVLHQVGSVFHQYVPFFIGGFRFSPGVGDEKRKTIAHIDSPKSAIVAINRLMAALRDFDFFDCLSFEGGQRRLQRWPASGKGGPALAWPPLILRSFGHLQP
ncbi:MAG: hypothetical protein ACJ8FY_22335 [Gemmataceae bacterium]